MKTILKVLSTIIAIPFCIVGAVLLIPFVALCLLISLPLTVLEDIWSDK